MTCTWADSHQIHKPRFRKTSRFVILNHTTCAAGFLGLKITTLRATPGSINLGSLDVQHSFHTDQSIRCLVTEPIRWKKDDLGFYTAILWLGESTILHRSVGLLYVKTAAKQITKSYTMVW